MACKEQDAERVYQYMREVEHPETYDFCVRSHHYILAPTYRQIALALHMPQRYVRECIEHLEKTGRAKNPDFTTKQKKIGKLLYRDEDGRERWLTVYAGWNCFVVLTDALGRIVEVFDQQDRFNRSFDKWTVPGGTWKPYVRSEGIYGTQNWLKWQLNVNDSAWPGGSMARILKDVGKNYTVETYDEPV